MNSMKRLIGTVAKRSLLIVATAAAFIGLSGCGGGGGNPSSVTTGGTTSTTTSTSTSSSAPSLTLAVYDSSNNVVTNVTTGAIFTAKVIVKNSSGDLMAGIRVDFSTSDGNLSLSRTSYTTDVNGLATVVVSPSASSTGGGVTLNATATVNGVVKTESLNFNVGVGPSSTAAPTLTIGIYRVSNGAQVNAISYSEAYEVRATLFNSDGSKRSNELVTFDMGSFVNAVVTPTSLVTDANGVATVTIRPSSITATGGATITASATVGSTSVSNKTSFNVAPSSVSLSPIVTGSNSIASAANTSLSVTVSLGGSVASGVPISVTYSASCGRVNGGSSSAAVTTDGSGIANAVYEAVNTDGSLCSGSVTVTASSPGASSVTTSVNVAAAVANAITYISPSSAAQIFVAGSGALEQYEAQFKVLSGSIPLASQNVVFSLLVNPGGVGLDGAGSTANVTKQTDSSGIVKVTIFSGTIPGPVKVRAALASNTSVFAETQNLTVASGPASQRFMSVSVTTPNIEGWAIDGTTTKITARVADRQGNAVADGTVVNFTAEAGQVAYSCSTVQVNKISQCSVDFISQNPRPSGGRISVLAFLEGTKDYTDIGGNNKYDSGTDSLINMGDAYRDDNENGQYDPGEFVIPRGGTTVCGGAGGSFPKRVDTCDSSLATTVRQQVVLLYSSSVPTVTTTGPTVNGINFTLASSDNSKLPMPAGTTVSAQASGESVFGTEKVFCTVDKIYGDKVANIFPVIGDLSTSLATSHTVTLKNCVASAGHSVAITITAPSGLATTFSYQIP